MSNRHALRKLTDKELTGRWTDCIVDALLASDDAECLRRQAQAQRFADELARRHRVARIAGCVCANCFGRVHAYWVKDEVDGTASR